MEDALEVSSENLKLLQEESAMVDLEVIMRYIRIMSELASQMKYSSQKRVLLEIAIIKLCVPQMEDDFGSILDRISSLEQKMEDGIPVVAPMASAGMSPVEPIKKKELPKAIPEDVQEVLRKWSQICGECESPLLRTVLPNGKATVTEEGSFALVFDAHVDVEKTAYDTCVTHEGELKSYISNWIEKEVPVKLILNDSGYKKDAIYPDAISEILKNSNLQIETEDF